MWLGLGQELRPNPGFPQRLVFRAEALVFGPQRLVTDTASLLVDDRLLDALGGVVDRCTAVPRLVSTPRHGAPAPTQDRSRVANPYVNRYTQQGGEPP